MSYEDQITSLLKALLRFDDAFIVFTMPNADPVGRVISEKIEAFTKKYSQRTLLSPSLGQQLYFSCMKIRDPTIGNSSSGIIEAPHLGAITVNIGQRQNGRIRAQTVFDCGHKSDDIAVAIRNALAHPTSLKT